MPKDWIETREDFQPLRSFWRGPLDLLGDIWQSVFRRSSPPGPAPKILTEAFSIPKNQIMPSWYMMAFV